MAKIDVQKLAAEISSKYQITNETFTREVKSNPKDRIQVEIGDSKQPDFKPQFKFMRWDNEVNFSLRAEEHPAAKVSTVGEKIIYSTPEYEVHQYDKPEIDEDGGFEFEWILPKKPVSNVLTATIQTKGLNFYFQPPLTQKEIDEGASRPPNVEGSYAVYHATKGGMNRADGMEYKVGKAFHIYRPKVTDANGVETWGELNIDEQNGLLTVIIDQTWLDNAVYPLVVDPTFGYTSAGASSTDAAAAVGDVSRRDGRAVTLTEDGTLNSIHVALAASTGTPNVDTITYVNREDSEGSGVHGQVASVEVSNKAYTTTKTFHTFTAASEVIVADTYILNALGNGEDIASGMISYYYDDTISGNRYTTVTAGAGGYNTQKTSPWNDALQSTTITHSIYVTYTSTSTLLLDATSNNNDLANIGGITEVTASLPFAQSTSAIDLERGSSQYASLADVAQTGLDLTGDFTFECWIKLESAPASGEEWPIISKFDYGNNNRSYYFNYKNNAGTLQFNLQMTSNGGTTNRDRINWNKTLSTGVWYHIAVVVDISAAASAEAELYVDTVSEGNGSVEQDGSITAIFNGTAPFAIGAVFQSGALGGEGTFDGQIDDVRVWSDIRTSTEIANNYNIELVGNEANLVGYWPFETTLGGAGGGAVAPNGQLTTNTKFWGT